VKLRTSVGLRVDKIIAPGVQNPHRGEVELCGVDRFTTLMFNIMHESPLKEEERVHYQLAVLYTSPDRQRKIRVHNMNTIATHKPTIVFRNSDIEAVVVSLMKEAVDRALSSPLSEEPAGARCFLDNAVANALLKYRLNCSPQSPKGQLVLPDSLKVLPVFTLAMLKHPALMENRSALGKVNTNVTSSPTMSLLTNADSTNGTGTNLSRLAFIPTYGSALSRVAVRASERSSELRRMISAPVVEVINSLYPRMYNISALFSELNGINGAISSHTFGNSDEDLASSSGDMNCASSSMDFINSNSMSFNNLLVRHAAGLQMQSSPGTGGTGGVGGMGGASSTAFITSAGMIQTGSRQNSSDGTTGNAAAELALLAQKNLLHKLTMTLSPTSEVFESDQVYLLDDRSTLYLYVGRSVSPGEVEEMMETTPGASGLGRQSYVTLRSDTESGRHLLAIVQMLRVSCCNKQGM
jgi:hypothetical protein